MQNKTKSRLILVGLILCFILPMLLAHYYYRHPGILKGSTNRGHLINPPLLLKNFPLQTLSSQFFDKAVLLKKWTLIYVSSTSCAEVCQHNLYKMRQVRIATNKERERVNRLLVLVMDKDLYENERKALNVVIGTDYPGTVVARTALQPLLNFSAETQLPESGYFYLADPLGNILLRYPGDVSPEDLFKDLKHLLQISQIG